MKDLILSYIYNIRLYFSIGFFVLFLCMPSHAFAAAQFIQERDSRINSGTVSTLPFHSSNQAGNLIVVYVVWDNTGSVIISDTNNNVYTSAVGPTKWSKINKNAQVFYAKNIVGGANTVTAQFSKSISAFADVYIHEYSGIDNTNPLDVVKSATGTSSAMNSGSVKTTYASDLLFSAGASSNLVTKEGTGFTVRTFGDGNITQDRSVKSIGSYSATATQNSNAWVMQLAAFRTSTASPTPTATPSFTPTPTATMTPTNTPTPTITPTPTSMPSITPTIIPTDTVTPTLTVTPTPTVSGIPVYPLTSSTSHRYLIDQNQNPFLIFGDSAQAMIGAASITEANTYFANRAAKGINLVWTHIICGSSYSGCHGDGTTYDGIAPFTSYLPGTTTYDISKPNSTYFDRVDQIVALAAQYHIALMMSPMETINWLPTLRANGTSRAYTYGAYLASRYKNLPNVLWFHGNDFQTWNTPSDDAVVMAVSQGIQSVDTNHIQTVELDFPTSASLNDSNWRPYIGLDLAYSYYSTYDQVLREYNRSSIMPTFFHEGVYEFQDYMGGYTGPHELRTQEYWTQLSGAAGNVYGNRYIFRFEPGEWQLHLDDIGMTQFTYWKNLFASHRWYDLIPDQSHSIVTAGYGTYQSISAQVIGNTSDYTTTASTADGKLVLSYMPTRRTISVDMSKLAGPATAQWFDPTNGIYTSISGSPFANSGSRQFTPPAINSGGDTDWVLILESQ